MSQDHLTTQSHMISSNRNNIIFITQILVYYAFVYIIGLIVYYRLTVLNIPIDTIAPKGSILNSFYILGTVLLGTGILLIFIRFKKFPILKLLELFVLLTSLMTLINLYLGFIESVSISIALILIKEYLKSSIYTNLILSVILGFIGGYFAYSLDILPIIVLIILLSLYDYIAVFKTGHMVTIAKEVVSKNLAFTYEFKSFKKDDKNIKKINSTNNLSNTEPTGVRNKFNLGTGDYALPVIPVILFTTKNVVFGIMSFLIVFISLAITIIYLINYNKKALPALPLQGIVITILYIIYITLL